ncbi:MAG: glycine cleavage system aminomethyltransferase GcvT [Planctomycetota bacterium]|nr:glycine cleavage system aminomethyltransferase GcvT [Planctomycetota bacterium]
MTDRNPFFFSGPLAERDPLLNNVVEAEKERQQRKLILIASESICPQPVREATSNVFSNIYAEGYPAERLYDEERDRLDEMPRQLALLRRYQDRRFYKGTEYADLVEAIAIRRAQHLFATDKYAGHPNPTSPDEIFVNVQAHAGASANNAVYNAFLEPGDTLMGLKLDHGGHLTHGSKFNRSGATYNIVHYGIDPKTGHISYDEIREKAHQFKPKMLIAGASAYPWEMDFVKLREICDETGTILFADVAHPSGLMACGLLMSPVGLADVITTTTHKTLCGPRGAIILTTNERYANMIDVGVFPGEQGGPHINQMAGKAVSFMLDNTEDYSELMKLVIQNAKALSEALAEEGLTIAYGGTENHLCLVDLRKIKSPTGHKLTGEMASRILDLIGITCNKNTIAGDSDAAQPGGIRLGTTWITQRGMKPEHMPRLAKIIARALTSTYTFRYMESDGFVGRAKVDFGIYEELKSELAALVADIDAETEIEEPSGYPYFFSLDGKKDSYDAGEGVYNVRGHRLQEHLTSEKEELVQAGMGAFVDCPQHGVLLVGGDRARAGLQEICAGDVLALEVGDAMRTFVLDADGGVIDDIELARIENEGEDDRYIVIARGSRFEKLKTWLRELSDCYIVTDREEFYAKVEGPYVANDLTLPEEGGWKVLNVFGEDISKLTGCDEALSDLEDGCVRWTEKGNYIMALPFGDEKRVVIAGKAENVVSCEKWLVDNDFTRCGVGIVAHARKQAHLPVYVKEGEEFDGAEFVEHRPEMFKLSKCNFVGWRHLPKPEPSGDRTRFEWKEPDHEPYKSCLYDVHLEMGGKMVPFAGWTMPVSYNHLGTDAEHQACRNAGALFDVSHMGVLDFRGENVIRFLDQVTTNYVHWLKDGEGHYSYLLDVDGVPHDDILLYRLSRTHFLMVVNAVNAEKDEAWLRGVNEGRYIVDERYPYREIEARVEIRNLKDVKSVGDDARVDLAFQGPKTLDVLLALADELDFRKKIYRLGRFCLTRGTLKGIDVYVARTGYTGEPVGYELYVHPHKAQELWKALLEEGKQYGIEPAGLGARDSTRTEAGLPLYGHELAGPLNVSPLEAGYGFAVRLHKPYFIGRDVMLEQEKNLKRILIRCRATRKATRMLSTGDPVLDRNGKVVGNVTSSVVVDGYQIVIAYVDSRADKKGSNVFCYPLGAIRKKEKLVSELRSGDRSVVPVELEVISRFMRKKEDFPIIINWNA